MKALQEGFERRGKGVKKAGALQQCHRSFLVVLCILSGGEEIDLGVSRRWGGIQGWEYSC